jgi:hypothetical protein
MLVIVLYGCLLVGNLLLRAAGFYFGPRLGRLCLIALWVNALALALLVIPLSNPLIASNPPPDAGAATKILVLASVPLLAEFVALIAVFQWWRRVGPRFARALSGRCALW